MAVAAVVIARLRLRRGSRWMTTKAMAKLSRRVLASLGTFLVSHVQAMVLVLGSK